MYCSRQPALSYIPARGLILLLYGLQLVFTTFEIDLFNQNPC